MLERISGSDKLKPICDEKKAAYDVAEAECVTAFSKKNMHSKEEKNLREQKEEALAFQELKEQKVRVVYRHAARRPRLESYLSLPLTLVPAYSHRVFSQERNQQLSFLLDVSSNRTAITAVERSIEGLKVEEDEVAALLKEVMREPREIQPPDYHRLSHIDLFIDPPPCTISLVPFLSSVE